MKKILYRLSVIVIAVLATSSCADNDIEIFDARNGRAIAGFSNPTESPNIIFNPAEDTENILTIGVSTRSDSDRAVVLDLDLSETTLGSEFYTISNLNPVIPAGEFTVDIVITTIATGGLPDPTSIIALNLVSVADSEILAESRSELEIGLSVKCPSVDLENVTGNGEVVVNEILVNGFGAPISLSGSPKVVLAGPEENQLTIVGGVSPALGADDLIIEVNPDTGSVSYAGPEDAVFIVNGGNPVAYRGVTGQVLTCIGLISLQIEGPFVAPFDQNAFDIQF